MFRSLAKRFLLKRFESRREPASDAAKVEVILQHSAWRRVVLVGVGGAVTAFLSGILTELPSALTLDSAIYGVSGCVLLGIASVLLVNPGSLKRVTTWLIAASGSFFLFRLSYLLFGATPAADVPQQLTESFFWVPVVYVLGHLIPGLTLGRKLALATNLGILLISSIYVFSTGFETDMKVLEALIQLNLANWTFAYAVRSFSIYREKALEAYTRGEVMTQLAYTDALTGLTNRLRFEQLLRDALVAAEEAEQRVAVIFIDLDHFKRVNDARGHAAGDELLIGVAERLRSNVRKGDLLARLGGDEFVLMLPHLDNIEDVDRIVGNLKSLFASPFKLSTGALQLSASIGSSLFPDDANSAERLLGLSDMAMYEAKAAGRARSPQQPADEAARQLN